MTRPPDVTPKTGLLTNRALVLLAIAADASVRVRDIAGIVGITERTAQRIVGELVANDYIIRHRVGRRSTYEVRVEAPLRGPRWFTRRAPAGSDLAREAPPLTFEAAGDSDSL